MKAMNNGFYLGERFFTVVEPGLAVSDQHLNRLEKKLEMTLPSQLRNFYLQFNGGGVSPSEANYDTHSVVSLKWRPDQDAAMHGDDDAVGWFYKVNVKDDPDFYGIYEKWLNFKDALPAGLLPFADNSGGSQYLIDTRPGTSGKIYFWRLGYGTIPQSFDNIAYVADSFEEFLLAIRADEG